MKLKIIYYKDVDKREWDEWVGRIGETNYQHSWNYINFLSKFLNIKENCSFACFDENMELLAVCPLAIAFNEKDKYFEISFGGSAAPVPALAEHDPGPRRKILDEIFAVILSCVKKYDAKKIKMAWNPLTEYACSSAGNQYSFELLRYQMHYLVNNTVVADLRMPEEKLFSLVGKYHRRHIQRGKKKGLAVRIFDSGNNTEELKKYFKKFQESHYKSAGRMTRPQETWDAMLKTVYDGEASLFATFVKDEPISYLYCGEFKFTASGWSQVNIDEYEKEYCPRHILEWEAMLFYKKKGLKYYEIGERYYGPQLFYIPTEKEISICVFKERYGGTLLPTIQWIGYCDKKIMKREFKEKIKLLNKQNNAVFSIPAKI